MWVRGAVCELVAINLGSLAATVGSQPLIFAWIAGSKPPLFASPSDLVCGPLQLGGAAIYGVISASLRESAEFPTNVKNVLILVANL